MCMCRHECVHVSQHKLTVTQRGHPGGLCATAEFQEPAWIVSEKKSGKESELQNDKANDYLKEEIQTHHSQEVA